MRQKYITENTLYACKEIYNNNLTDIFRNGCSFNKG